MHDMPSPTRENPKPLPLLQDIYKLNHTSFDKIIEFHTDVLFHKFPPTLMVFDYTNERTFTDIIEARFGKSRVTKINFLAGISGTKKMLKDDGLSILNYVGIFSDQDVLGYGIGLILLNVGIQSVAIIGIKKNF
jgi:hypothetical protein